MTRDQAIAAAREQAIGRQLAVYRFRAWRDGVFGVRDPAQLPKDAETFEVFGELYPSGPSVPVSGCKSSDSSKNASKTPSTFDAQGSLF